MLVTDFGAPVTVLEPLDHELPAASREAVVSSRDLFELKEDAVAGHVARATAKQRGKGKLSARERIDLLVDEGSFVELDRFSASRTGCTPGADGSGDGVVTGYARIGGRPVCLFSQDVTFMGGSLGEVHAERVIKVMELALRVGQPLIGINDGAGARIQDGVVSQAMYAEIFRRNVRASGVVPQISLIMGYCAGGAAYSPALTDFVVMVDRASHMFITGPDVVRTVTGEDVDVETLGGGLAHGSRSGNVHYVGADEQDAIGYARDLLAFLPDNHLSVPAPVAPGAPGRGAVSLDDIVPASPATPYDMQDVIGEIVDDGDFLEVQELFARNIIVGFARVEGISVGIVASQPMHFAGCLDIDSSEKAARFVRTCNSFNVPVLTLVDVPGFLPGTEQEWNGIIRRGAKLIYAYAEATVPLVTVITRKAYGAGYDVLGSKHLGADINLAWPTAEIAVMGAEGATGIVHRRHLERVEAEGGDVASVRAKLEQRYREELCTPYTAAERGYVDAVIRPSETRDRVADALRLLSTKRDVGLFPGRGNMPV